MCRSRHSRSSKYKRDRMADIKPEHKPEDGENYAMANNTDPKNMQELTQFVS